MRRPGEDGTTDRAAPGPAVQPVPERIKPMLAVPGRRRSFGTEWVFERKLDGVRAIAFRDGDDIRLTSRTGRPLERTYPEIVQALARQPLEHFVVDGEIVAMNRGRTDFARLQRRMHITDPVAAGLSSIRVTYYLFDLLHLGGYDTTVLPLRSRKSLLRRAVEFTGPLRYNAHRNADPGARDLLDDACRRGWEGLVAKRADSRYQQRRSPDWVKLKCTAAQELVIAGFTEPSGSRLGFGALLLGYYEGGRLRYAGKAGTGYDDATLVGLRRRLDTLEQPHPAFDEPVAERTAHWVRPELVARIDFTEWTADGRLRHPRFVGLRDDKKAAEVIREYPASA